MDPLRIDRVHHNEKICDKLIAEIRTSHFLIADVTLQRAGVYFEAGFAMGLGRPVIWTCRQDDMKNVHFDTRQYSHVVWTDPYDLRTKLADRIKATISGGDVRILSTRRLGYPDLMFPYCCNVHGTPPPSRTGNHVGLPLEVSTILFAFFAGAMNRGPRCSFLYCPSPVS